MDEVAREMSRPLFWSCHALRWHGNWFFRLRCQQQQKPGCAFCHFDFRCFLSDPHVSGFAHFLFVFILFTLRWPVPRKLPTHPIPCFPRIHQAPSSVVDEPSQFYSLARRTSFFWTISFLVGRAALIGWIVQPSPHFVTQFSKSKSTDIKQIVPFKKLVCHLSDSGTNRWAEHL